MSSNINYLYDILTDCRVSGASIIIKIWQGFFNSPNLSNYSVLIWYTHGGFALNDDYVLATGLEWSISEWTDYVGGIVKVHIDWGKPSVDKSVIGITGNFWKEKYTNNPLTRALFLNGACSGYKNDKFREVLQKIGVVAYTGWTTLTTKGAYGDYGIIYYMAQGKTLQEAYDLLPDDYKQDSSNSSLLWIGPDNTTNESSITLWSVNTTTTTTTTSTTSTTTFSSSTSSSTISTTSTTITTTTSTTSISTTTTTVQTSSNSWIQKTDFGGTARYWAVGFSIGSKGYIGTGESYNGSGNYYVQDFWEYNSSTNAWTQKADFSGGNRNGAIGFSIGSKGYIGTGTYSDGDFWEYDPATNGWTQKADFGGTARFDAVGFSIGSKGYVGTGWSGYSSPSHFKDFWEYNPETDTWTQKADFAGEGRQDAVGFSIGSKGYIGTGYDGSVFYKDFWEYDPVTNGWTQKSDFAGTARAEAVGFSIGSRGYIGTGQLSSWNLTKECWEYNPVTDKWTQKADFGGTERYWAVGFSIGSKGYIGTGAFNVFSHAKDFWEYTP